MSYKSEEGNGFDGYDGYVVRIRGLPWSASQEEVANFLSGEHHSCINDSLQFLKTDTLLLYP